MGGYGALRFVLKYPGDVRRRGAAVAGDLRSRAAADLRRAPGGVFGAPDFDPQVWKQLNYPALWDAFLAKKVAVPMYINSGDDDDFFIEAEATRLYSLLRKNGQPAELRIVDGPHSWTVWESTIGDALRYVFRYRRPAGRCMSPRDAKARKSR